MVRGSYFGEDDVIFKRKRTKTVRAVVDSHLLTLSKNSFENVIVAEYPELVDRMKSIAQERDNRCQTARQRTKKYLQENADNVQSIFDDPEPSSPNKSLDKKSVLNKVVPYNINTNKGGIPKEAIIPPAEEANNQHNENNSEVDQKLGRKLSKYFRSTTKKLREQKTNASKKGWEYKKDPKLSQMTVEDHLMTTSGFWRASSRSDTWQDSTAKKEDIKKKKSSDDLHKKIEISNEPAIEEEDKGQQEQFQNLRQSLAKLRSRAVPSLFNSGNVTREMTSIKEEALEDKYEPTEALPDCNTDSSMQKDVDELSAEIKQAITKQQDLEDKVDKIQDRLSELLLTLKSKQTQCVRKCKLYRQQDSDLIIQIEYCQEPLSYNKLRTMNSPNLSPQVSKNRRSSAFEEEEENEQALEDIRMRFLKLPFDTKVTLINWCKDMLNNERKGSVPFNLEEDYLNSIARKQSILQSVIHVAPLLPWFVIVCILLATVCGALIIPFFKMITCDSPYLASAWRSIINVLFAAPLMIHEIRKYGSGVNKLFSTKNMLTVLLCQVFGVMQFFCQLEFELYIGKQREIRNNMSDFSYTLHYMTKDRKSVRVIIGIAKKGKLFKPGLDDKVCWAYSECVVELAKPSADFYVYNLDETVSLDTYNATISISDQQQ
eukprot:TRINITY_DN1234_c0_g1_i2.p1 TRINITY_DN1234_c0_g1~~TRINITY_DN1234_c0_g1_i2.p1  ORF type:complete len:658 (-),score=52.87 TRINITY_DN1234_c0_g1_i2:4098-6071(-)